MGTKVFANGRGISSEDSGGQSVVFPDGDEAGTAGGGVMSSSTQGPGDPLFHDKKNIMG